MRLDKIIADTITEIRLGHYALPQLTGIVKRKTKKVKGYSVNIIDNGVYQLAMVPLAGPDIMKTIDTKGVHPVSSESVVINVMHNYNPNQKQPVIYATLMLWKKSGQQWTDEELVPVKKIEYQMDDQAVKVLFHNKDINGMNVKRVNW